MKECEKLLQPQSRTVSCDQLLKKKERNSLGDEDVAVVRQSDLIFHQFQLLWEQVRQEVLEGVSVALQ